MKKKYFTTLFISLALINCLFGQAYDYSISGVTIDLTGTMYKLLANVMTGYSAYYDYESDATIGKNLILENIGVPRENYEKGTLSLPDDLFKQYSSAYFGPTINIMNFPGKSEINLGFLFSLSDEKKYSYYSTFDDGYGGSDGFTAEYKTDITIRNPIIINTDYKYKIAELGDSQYFGLILNCAVRPVFYNIVVNGKRWYYNKNTYYDKVEYAGDFKAAITKRENLNFKEMEEEQFDGAYYYLDVTAGLSFLTNKRTSLNISLGTSFPKLVFKVIGSFTLDIASPKK